MPSQRTLRKVATDNERLATLEHALRVSVAAARADGWRWDDVGMVLGVTKQAAQQRFGSSATPEGATRSA